MPEFPLGWREPDAAYRARYEPRYGLAAELPKLPGPTPVVIGVAWYSGWDRPTRGSDGAMWVGRGDWGSKRGGHSVCLRPPSIADLDSAWKHFDQGREGACVGFATSRAASLFNRRLYNGYELYKQATTRDPWEGDWRNYSGTSVEAGLNTLRLDGAWPVRAGVTSGPLAPDGIVNFYWAKTVAEIKAALGSSEPFARLLNSWGAAYPREVRVPWEAIERLLREGGEFAALVDRT